MAPAALAPGTQQLSDADCSDGVRLAVRGVEGGRMAPNTASSPSNTPTGFPSPVLLSPAPIAPPGGCNPGSVDLDDASVPVWAKLDSRASRFNTGKRNHEGARCRSGRHWLRPQRCCAFVRASSWRAVRSVGLSRCESPPPPPVAPRVLLRVRGALTGAAMTDTAF
ncbi:MAG: hypothetical protein ACPIOQ_28565 [Promethearchaeia archaeon]